VKSIDLGAFFGVSKLEHLDLSGNGVKVLNAVSLSVQNAIKMAHNQLERIDAYIMVVLKSALEIDFMGNMCIELKYKKMRMKLS
jgi:hypothetical protein